MYTKVGIIGLRSCLLDLWKNSLELNRLSSIKMFKYVVVLSELTNMSISYYATMVGVWMYMHVMKR